MDGSDASCEVSDGAEDYVIRPKGTGGPCHGGAMTSAATCWPGALVVGTVMMTDAPCGDR